MQAFDLLINNNTNNNNNNNNNNKDNNPHPPDLPHTMSSPSTPIHNNNESPSSSSSNDNHKPRNDTIPITPSRTNHRPTRACTVRAAAARLHQNTQTPPQHKHQQPLAKKKEQPQEQQQDSPQCTRIITPLVSSFPPPAAQLPRWTLRSMWELASVLHFLHVFRPLLNIGIEFSAEELETALLTPNDTLGEIHMPLLKAIPPITRISLGRNTWITILCRKLRDWWYWVADGDIPIVASQGAEVDAYNALDPGVRVVILKAICDIRVEQEDIRSYIDNSLKHGVQLSAFRKERVGGDSYGISYWYEDDPIIGHRLYREIRKVEVKKVKAKGSQVLSTATYQWETVATNLDEFQDVSEKLFTSKNRTEASLGKKLKNDMLPEIEKVHKRKEKLLKKQHREALLLDTYMSVDGLGPGRSLRDRKRVTYTFDDYDRSINEAIKITKQKQLSPEPADRKEVVKLEAHENGKRSAGPSQAPQHASFSALSPNSTDFDEFDEEHKLEELDRGNRRRQRPQRYSAKEFIEEVSDNEANFESDDDIVGEAVYDDEYLKTRNQRRKLSSDSEGDDEYRGDEENAEDEEEEEEEEEDDSLSASEESDEPQRYKKLPGRTRRETKLRSVRELQSGLRRSNRATRNRINYRQYEFSESENESMRPENSNASDDPSDASENAENSEESRDSDGNENDDKEMKVNQSIEDHPVTVEEERNQMPEKSSSPAQNELHGVKKRRFLDLNELAPSSGFDDSPNTIMKDDADDS